jgi:ribulose-5-phosphate 4-epimerase/fuculose-1-phosphate aldolase
VSQLKAAPSRPREAEDRALVALACRVMAAAGLFDMHGHISLRDGDLTYINGRRASRISVTPAQVAVVKVADGTVVSGEPPAETALHLGCYRARPDIRSVAHFHPLAATAFATVGKPLITAFNAGAPFGRSVPVYDDPDLVRNDEQGRALSRDLADHRAVLLRGHGVAVVADDVPSCVTLSLYLEENAKRLAYAMTIGEPQPYTDDEIRRVAASLWQPFVIEKTWIDAQERARRTGALDDLG